MFPVSIYATRQAHRIQCTYNLLPSCRIPETPSEVPECRLPYRANTGLGKHPWAEKKTQNVPEPDTGIALQVEASPGFLPEMGRDANRGLFGAAIPLGLGQTSRTHTHTRMHPTRGMRSPMAVGTAGLAPCSLQGVKSAGKAGQIGDARNGGQDWGHSLSPHRRGARLQHACLGNFHSRSPGLLVPEGCLEGEAGALRCYLGSNAAL